MVAPTVDPPWPKEPELKLRSYQYEMLQASLHRNIIVAMDTGSGKTHIAIARILAELERSDPTKLVWFLSPSVALNKQQHALLQQHLAAYRVITLMGADGVDKWTDQRLWDAVLLNVRVVVGTPAVLSDALSHGFVRMHRLCLIVFDEAHGCIKDAPGNVIMRNFYHPSKAKGEMVPHILGLTASPVMGAKKGGLERIEANLDAVAMTPKRERQTLERFVHVPKIVRVAYTAAAEYICPSKSRLCDVLHLAAATYNLRDDPYIIDLMQRNRIYAQELLRQDESSCQLLPQQSLAAAKPKTYCQTQLHTLSRKAAMIYEQYGYLAADWYIRSYISRFQTPSQDFCEDITVKEKQHLRSIYADILASADDSTATEHSSDVSEKVQKLFDLLESQASLAPRGIVFVEQRASVSALVHLIRIFAPTYRVGGFVGTSANSARKTSVAELQDAKEYLQDLDDFRNGVKNLIVATNVLEEGIDVSACNLVVCFDLPSNLVSFVQRRGRARQKGSMYCLFIADNDYKSNPTKWQALEAEMKEAYMSERPEPELVEVDNEATSSRVYRVETTGALLTIESAKSHLYHFCAVSTLQASNYVDVRPEFAPKEVGQHAWSATVTLPSFVHSEIRMACSSRTWATEALAIKDAAFEAYIALHKAGLLNDNLLPLVKDYGPDVGQHIDQPSIVEVRERQSVWEALSCKDEVGEIYATEVCVRGDGREVNVNLLLPTPLLEGQEFSLYWNEEITYSVKVKASSEDAIAYSVEEVQALRRSTSKLLRTAHNYPPSAAADYFRGNTSVSDCGLIRTCTQLGRRFVFSRILSASDSEGCERQMLIVRAFPKRRDFLHRISQSQATNAAYTAEQMLPMDDCTVDHIPYSGAVVAAFLPSIVHRIEIGLLAQDVQTNALRDVRISSTALVLEAITAPSAGESVDYNRLEYLGDSILKFCAYLQVMAEHLTWPEGYLTAEKGRLVGNNTLAQAVLNAGLDQYILTKSFTGSKWRPPCMSDSASVRDKTETRKMSSKTLADVGEAMIGAAYVDGGLSKAYHCIRVLLPEEIWFDDHFTPLHSGLGASGHTSLGLLEQLIGHKFKHKLLLVEAVTHASLPFSGTGMSYERMEFLGDAVLDLIIVPKLFSYTKRPLRHWQMHSIHEALVNGHFLGYCCMSYSIGESTARVQEGVRNGDLEVQHTTRIVHLYDFLRAASQVVSAKASCLIKYDEIHSRIDETLKSEDTYPWPELWELNPPKFLSDCVESVLGALYVDTQGDLAVCEAFIERLGILRVMQRLLDENVETMSPKERLGIAAGNERVKYLSAPGGRLDGSRCWSCAVSVTDEVVGTASGCAGKMEAEVKAADQAVRSSRMRLGTDSKDCKRNYDLVDAGFDAQSPVEDGLEVMGQELRPSN